MLSAIASYDGSEPVSKLHTGILYDQPGLFTNRWEQPLEYFTMNEILPRLFVQHKNGENGLFSLVLLILMP